MSAGALSAEDIVELFEDFPSFCSLLPIKLVSGKGMVKFSPDRWYSEQRAFDLTRTGRDIVLKPRQIGFSTLELARDLQFALVNPGSNVLVVSQDPKLKEQLFLNLRVMADELMKLGLLPRTRYSTKTELVFADTNSAVRVEEAGATVRVAQSKGRSGTVHRLHATEMAFWRAASETWAAIGGSIPDDAEVVIESTANGAGGLFYDMVQAALLNQGQYKFHFFAWHQQRRYRSPLPDKFDPLPRDKWEAKLRGYGCNDQQIAWWRYKFLSPEFGPDKTLQEYPVDAASCFRASGRSYLEQDVIDDLFERVREPLETVEIKWQGRRLGELRVFRRFDPKLDYVAAGDVAEGVASDGHSCTVLERDSALVAATFWADNIEPGDFGLAMAVIGRMYGEALLAPERENHGHATLRALVHEAKYKIGRIYKTDDGKLGWSTNAVTRPVMVDLLGGAIRTKLAYSPDRAAVAECQTLIRNDKGKVEARGKGTAGGCKDDRFISWAIAFQVRSKPVQEVRRVNLPPGM